MTELTADLLVRACGDDSRDAGIAIRAQLEPIAGDGAPVKPAIYAGGVYQQDRRWTGEGTERRVVDAIVIDNVPSQANRLEAALKDAAGDLGIPQIVLDLSSVGELPPHLPRQISSLEFPHRQADAYLRDCTVKGQAFARTDIGAALLAATADNPSALYEWFPQALLFGYWQSHLGKKASQAKLARSWVSEIVGFEPAAVGTKIDGLKGDPLNLNVDEEIRFDEDNQANWELVAGSKKEAKSGKKERLAHIGHGQIPFKKAELSPAAVSFRSIEQLATVTFPSLRRIWTGDDQSSATGRALLVSLGLLAHARAFGRPFSLRSGCDLRPRSVAWTWLGADRDDALAPLSIDAAQALFADCVAAAEAAGLPVGSKWVTELIVEPSDALAGVIRSSWPAED